MNKDIKVSHWLKFQPFFWLVEILELRKGVSICLQGRGTWKTFNVMHKMLIYFKVSFVYPIINLLISTNHCRIDSTNKVTPKKGIVSSLHSIMINFDHWIKGRVNIRADFNKKKVRKHFAVLQRIERQVTSILKVYLWRVAYIGWYNIFKFVDSDKHSLKPICHKLILIKTHLIYIAHKCQFLSNHSQRYNCLALSLKFKTMASLYPPPMHELYWRLVSG